MRWECDSQGFSGTIFPLRVPAFSATDAFCLDARSETQDFVGFDVIGMTGAPVLPGEVGVGWAEVVTGVLGEGLRETIDLGIHADRCLDGNAIPSDPNAPDCVAFRELMGRYVAPSQICRSTPASLAWTARIDSTNRPHRAALERHAPTALRHRPFGERGP